MFKLNVITITFLLVCLKLFVEVTGCYWNDHNRYLLFGSKTPYDTVRGDIRDYNTPQNCEAVSIWNINRHGNKNPGYNVTMCMRDMAGLKDEIIASYEAGTSQLCAQDIENLRNWSWNSTLEVSQAFLTGPGYEELYNIGKRIREKYRHLFEGNPDQFHLRPTYEQRSIVSCVAFVHGLTDGIPLNVTVEKAWDRDDVIGPSMSCDLYLKKIRFGKTVMDKISDYYKSERYEIVRHAVQTRLGIQTHLNVHNVFCIYNLCRYISSWNPNRRSPWCAAFSTEDLQVLEYYDDIVHYYRNGYGSWVNVNLGKTALKDMYVSLEAAMNGNGKRLTSYFTHNTMMGMVFAAIGFNSGDNPLQGDVINANRIWRTSFSAAFSSNIIAVLNKCNGTNQQNYRVQLFINEKEMSICPLEGCTWEEFREKFKVFKSLNLNFCKLDYPSKHQSKAV